MGKKSKKGKKGSGKKKKGGKKKKTADIQMTWKEALLAYQINIKERTMEDLRYEIRGLEEQKDRHMERNARLKQEQAIFLKNLLKQAKNYKVNVEEEIVTDKSAVLEAMMDQWEAERQGEKGVQEVKEQIAHKEAENILAGKQVQYWTEYRDKGQHQHRTQIQLLEEELRDMKSTFEEMTGYLEESHNKVTTEIKVRTERTLDQQKYLATEKAMAKMDKFSRQEVLDNDWLLREVEIHKEECSDLMLVVEEMERENLEIMSQLFDCTADDLKISREFYLTQFMDKDNLDYNGILEMDLSTLSIHDRDTSSEHRIVRPKSATQKFIEQKVFSLPAVGKIVEEEESEEEDSQYESSITEGSEEGDPFNNYFHFDDEEFDDYLKLGPLELKLLNVTGTKMPVFKPKTPTEDEMEATDFSPEQWPVTVPMLHDSVTTK